MIRSERASGGVGESDADPEALTAGVAGHDLALPGGVTGGLEAETHASTGRNGLQAAGLERLLGDGQFDQVVHGAEAVAIEM